MNDDENVVDAQMFGESGDGARDNRHPADWTILLWAAILAGCPRPAACRNNKRCNSHLQSLGKAIKR
jgi:hypothetical protein